VKLKELPKSIYHTTRLAHKPIDKFGLENKERVPLVVSLTSIPSRLKKLHIVIRCLFDQTVLPQKILLWLHESLKGHIPKKLLDLEGALFEIRYTHMEVSHKKLIHTIPLFPELPIVTCDDDFIYHPQWLQSLYEAHQMHPETVLANHIRTIGYDDSGMLLSYKQWVFDSHKGQNPRLFLAIGGKGVLYPPRALFEQFDDEDLFMKLAPKADDLWFKAMELLQGTPVRLSPKPMDEPIPIAGTQGVSLKKENISEDKNRNQWLALEKHFKLKDYY